MFRSITTRLTCSVALFVCLLMMATAFCSLAFFEEEMKSSVRKQQFVMVSAIARQVDREFADAQDMLQTLAGVITPRMLADEELAQRFLEGRPNILRVFNNSLFLFSPSGRLLAAIPREMNFIGQDFSSRSYFKETMATGRPHISGPFLSRQKTPTPISMFTVPVRDDSGRIVAVLGGSLDLTRMDILKELVSLQLGGNGFFHLYDRNRTFVAHHDPGKVLQQIPAGSNETFDKAIAGFEGVTEGVTTCGLPALITSVQMKHTGWILEAGYPLAGINSVVFNAKRFFVIGGILSVLASLALTRMLMGRLLAPLLKFTRQVHEMSRADAEHHPLQPKSLDEIGQMAMAFNELLRCIDGQKAALQQQALFSRTLLETIPIPVFQKDGQGRYAGCNPAFEAFMGVSRSDLLGRTAADILPPEVARLHEEEDRKAMHARQDMVYEGAVVSRKGFRKEGVFYKAAIVDAAGASIGLVGAVLDITERKSMERKQEEDRRFLQTMLDSIRDLIFYKDSDGVYLGCNSAYAEGYIGKPKEQIVGHTDWDFVPDRHLIGRFLESDRITMESGSSQLIRHWIMQANGDRALIEVHKTPFHDAAGNVGGVIGVARDITEHQKAMDEITRERETAQRYLEIAGVMFCALDRSGTIIMINRKGSEMLGYGDGELLGQDWFDVCLPPAIRERVRGIFAMQLAGNLEPVEFYENKVINRTGEERLIAFHNTLLRDDDGISGVLFSGEDITDQRLIQAELLKNQKLESLAVLAGGIAHDFNNILTGILGNISFARSLARKDERVCVPLVAAEKGCQRAADLARQFLVFSKGKKLVKKMVQMEAIIEETVSLVLRGTKVKGVIDIPSLLDPVSADEGQLCQSLNNIVLNAVQAMPDGGVLTVTGENVRLDNMHAYGLSDGNYVTIAIADTGCGIPEENLRSIFDPYFTTRKAGTGLGLASTHSIITMHGGKIFVTSTPGEGTTFTIYLPSSIQISYEQDTPATDAPIFMKGKRILVMDDDDMIRAMAMRTLGSAGHEVVAAGCGDEAMTLYAEAREQGVPYDLAIFDLTIPGGMGGVEAARQVLAMDPDARIIVSSGYSDDDVMSAPEAYGFCAALEKPYSVEQVTRVMAEVGRSCRRRGDVSAGG